MLALGRAEGTLRSTPAIAGDMAIPVRFLPQVMGDLARAGLVESQPGRRGGYRLARRPRDISLLAIIEAVEGDSRRRTCVLRGGPCRRDGVCDVHEVFFGAQDALLSRLEAASLAEVVDGGGASRPGGTGGRGPG